VMARRAAAGGREEAQIAMGYAAAAVIVAGLILVAFANSGGIAQTFFTSHKDINVFATFGDQMAQGAITALKLVGGYTPGKNIQIIGYGGAKEIIDEVKAGTIYATLGLYPSSESVLGIQYLNDALNGKSVPNVVNIINPDTHPAIIDQAYLSSHPDFQPDWTLEG